MPCDRGRELAFRRARGADAEQGVDDEIGVVVGRHAALRPLQDLDAGGRARGPAPALVGRRRRLRADEQHRRALAHRAEPRRGLDAVAAVVARTGEHDDPLGMRREGEGEPGDRVAGARHQRERRRRRECRALRAGASLRHRAGRRAPRSNRSVRCRSSASFVLRPRPRLATVRRHACRSLSMPSPSISIGVLRPATASATRRADPAASAQPLPPWPTLSQMPSAPLGPSTGGPSGSIGRAPFQRCAALRRVTPGTSRRAPCRASPAPARSAARDRRRSRRCRRRARACRAG